MESFQPLKHHPDRMFVVTRAHMSPQGTALAKRLAVHRAIALGEMGRHVDTATLFTLQACLGGIMLGCSQAAGCCAVAAPGGQPVQRLQ